MQKIQRMNVSSSLWMLVKEIYNSTIFNDLIHLFKLREIKSKTLLKVFIISCTRTENRLPRFDSVSHFSFHISKRRTCWTVFKCYDFKENCDVNESLVIYNELGLRTEPLILLISGFRPKMVLYIYIYVYIYIYISGKVETTDSIDISSLFPKDFIRIDSDEVFGK